MSSSSNDAKDFTIVTVEAIIHYPRNTNTLPHDNQNKKNPKRILRKKQNKRNFKTVDTDEIQNLDEINTKNESRIKKQTVILKPLISTYPSHQKESKIIVKKPKPKIDSSLNDNKSEIFCNKTKPISCSSSSNFPDLEIEKENENKLKRKSSLSGIFSIESNCKVKEKYIPQITQNSLEEIDLVVRSPEPVNQSVLSLDEDILTVANKPRKCSTPMKKMKKFVPREVCVTETMQTTYDVDIIRKKKRFIKKESSNDTLDSLKPQVDQPLISNELIANSSDVIQSWKSSGKPVSSERLKRFSKLLSQFEKMGEEIPRKLKE